MGVYSQGRCYNDSSEAVDALFSSVVPSFSGDCLVTLVRSEEGWIVSRQCPTETYTFSAVPPGMPLCDPSESVIDGFVLGWAVVLVWVSAWAIKILSKAL